jgi:glycosyltransferase involved in cell wall biosynthesis
LSLAAAGLTVAIPFHRNVDYLRLAIESVRAQEHEDWQAIVCDDGLEDQGVAELVRSLGDERIGYQRNDGNQGIARSWNLCLDRADTELVTLLHADDLLRPGYIALMLELAAAHPDAVALCCRAEIIGADGRRAFALPDAVKRLYEPGGGDPVELRGESALAAVMAGNFVMCPTLCYRTATLGSRRFEEDWKQVLDLELVARLLMDGERIVFSRAREYAYRRHPEAATAVQSESRLRFDEEVELFGQVAARARTLGWERAAAVASRRRIVRLHLVYRALAAALRLDLAASGAWLRYLRGLPD